MTMEQVLQTIQLICAALLVVTILMQQRGSGLGGAFGSDNSSYRSRRGLERTLLRSTILFATVFLATSALLVII